MKRLFSKAGTKNNIFLYFTLFIYSLGGVFAKKASRNPSFSTGFFLFYGLTLAVLAAYALLWQQVLKRMPLATAFSNKAITVVFGMLWGAFFFSEKITPSMIVGAVIIFAGIYVITSDEAKSTGEPSETVIRKGRRQ